MAIKLFLKNFLFFKGKKKKNGKRFSASLNKKIFTIRYQIDIQLINLMELFIPYNDNPPYS